jgi:hypothetical protein
VTGAARPWISWNQAAALRITARSSVVWSSSAIITKVSGIPGPLAISNQYSSPGKYPVSLTT